MPRSAINSIACSIAAIATALVCAQGPARAGVIVDAKGDAYAPASGYTPTPAPLEGVVVASQSFWYRGRIVTESVVRTDAGDEVLLRQPGGTVDDISQVQFPSPALLGAGDRVSLIMDATRPDLAQPILELISLERSSKGVESGQVMKYVRTTNDFLIPLYWASGCIKVVYHVDGTTHLDGDLEFQVMDQVFTTWRQATQSCSYLTFDLEGREAREAELDLANVIVFREDVWGRPGCPEDPNQCHQPSAAAVTTVSYVNSETSARSGEIVDADIEMNAVGFDISANGVSNGQNGCYSDLANTLTHEVGHMMGLEHTCFIAVPRDTQGNPKPVPIDDQGNEVGFCNPNDPLELQATTMYPTQDCGETIKTTPEVDDIAGVCGIYPLAEDPGECAAPDPLSKRGCACSAGQGRDLQRDAGAAFALLFAALMLLAWRRRQSKRQSAMAMR